MLYKINNRELVEAPLNDKNMERQIFETPEMEMIEITVNDVIATSGEGEGLQPGWAPLIPGVEE